MTATATRPRSATGDRAAARAGNDFRRTLLALLASALGVFPLEDLFTDSGWLVDVWLTMIVVIAPAAVLRRTRPANAAQTWIGVLLLVPWLTLTFLHSHAVLGFLPFGGAWHDLQLDLTSLHHTTTDSVAPVHTTVAIRLALCAVLGLVAALVDMIAVVGRHGALAGVPLLIVFTVSGAVPRHPVTWIWFCVAAAAFLILLGLDSSDDLRRWGHFVPRSRKGKRRRDAASAQRIAVIAIAVALAVPVFLPSNSRNLLADLFHSGGNGSGFGADLNGGLGTAGIDPFVALHGELNREHSVPLFDVRITSSDGTVGTPGGVQPFYLRTNVLSNFTGDGWRAGPAGSNEPVLGSQFPSVPGTAFQPRVVNFAAQISITGLRSNPPVFASPTSISGVGASTNWSPRNLLLVDSQVDAGEVISEEVAQPQPTIAELRAVPRGPYGALADDLKLPPIRPYVRNLTAGIVAKATSPYERARAISNFFAAPASGFSYSLQTRTGDSGDDLTDFLHNRIGYCQQYAASMAVMLRLAGVPSRVVLGYAHGVPDDKGSFSVTTFDAHAWVEAYFTGIGWVPFDPTPLAGISGGAASDLAWASHHSGNSRPEPTAPRPTQTANHDHPTVAPVPQRRHHRAAPGVSPVVPLVLLACLAVIAALAFTPALVRWRRRRLRLHRIRRGDTEALWAELADTTVDLGYVWSDARTPRQVARWLGTSSDAASGPLHTLTSAVERARYSPSTGAAPVAGSGSATALDLSADLAQVRTGLGARRSPRERVRARFWPASLNWSHVRWIGRWLPGSDTARHR